MTWNKWELFVFYFIYLFLKWGLTLLPRLKHSDTISAHCSLHLLASSNSPASSSWVSRILPPCPANFMSFYQDSVSPCCPRWSWTPGLKQSAHFSLLKCWDHRYEPPHPADPSMLSLKILWAKWHYSCYADKETEAVEGSDINKKKQHRSSPPHSLSISSFVYIEDCW